MKELIAILKKLDKKYSLTENGIVVEGDLDLENTPIAELPDNLTIKGCFWLNNVPIEELPGNLTVGGYLDLRNTLITKLSGNLSVGGNLWLSNTPITKLPENLSIGGGLHLENTPIRKLPDNLTVGRGLDLRDTAITSLPNDLTVGGYIYSQNKEIKKQCQKVKPLTNGDYVEGNYLYADGILTHVKKKKQLGNYTLYIGKIPGRNVVYDGKNYAHCNSLREGIADLKFKEASDRGADQYKGLSLDTSVSLEEAKTMYRVITGACRQGTESFVNSLSEKKDTYTIRECIELTKGQYNAEKFEAFFQ